MKDNSVQNIIFDLAEVLIYGLLGVEETMAPELNITPEAYFESLSSVPLVALFEGRLTEDAFLKSVIEQTSWNISIDRMKDAIRANFHREVEGTLDIVQQLAPHYNLYLLSDHTREWITYIRSVYSFFDLFDRSFFSYDLGSIKENPKTFEAVLAAISAKPETCLFIDDSQDNCVVAESVGIRSIRFLDADQLRRELDQRGMLGTSRRN